MTRYEQQLEDSLTNLEEQYQHLQHKYHSLIYISIAGWVVTVLFLLIILGK